MLSLLNQKAASRISNVLIIWVFVLFWSKTQFNQIVCLTCNTSSYETPEMIELVMWLFCHWIACSNWWIALTNCFALLCYFIAILSTLCNGNCYNNDLVMMMMTIMSCTWCHVHSNDCLVINTLLVTSK